MVEAGGRLALLRSSTSTRRASLSGSTLPTVIGSVGLLYAPDEAVKAGLAVWAWQPRVAANETESRAQGRKESGRAKNDTVVPVIAEHCDLLFGRNEPEKDFQRTLQKSRSVLRRLPALPMLASVKLKR